MVARIAAISVFLLGLSSAMKLDMCRVKPPIMKNFELLKIEGQWYEYARLPNIVQLMNKERCNALDMTVNVTDMQFRTTFLNETSGNKVSYTGTMSSNPEKPGKIMVKLPDVGLSDYLSVLDADYNDFVVFYSCDTLWYFRIELAWVLTRQRTLSDERRERLIQKLKTLKIDTDRLEYEDHSNC